jgi:chromosomal replication initiator protein
MGISSEDQGFQRQWLRVSDTLKTEIGETAFENWVRPIKACDVKNSEVRLAVPSRFMRDWVVANYLDRLKELWARENNGVNSVDVIIQPSLKNKPYGAGKLDSINYNNDLDSKVVFKPNQVEIPTLPRGSGSQISAPLDERFKFDQFVVGKPNEFAYAAARRVAQASSVFF